MRAKKKPCPCGCKKFLVPPIINCQEATLSGDEADELVRRWNAFEPSEKPISKDSEVLLSIFTVCALDSLDTPSGREAFKNAELNLRQRIADLENGRQTS